jgi:hypothetical protein
MRNHSIGVRCVTLRVRYKRFSDGVGPIMVRGA